MLVSWQRKPSSNNWKRWVLVLKPGDAVYFALLFTLGLFITVAGIGVICALLGRMLGDIGNDWQILIGMVLVWVALGMLRTEKLSITRIRCFATVHPRRFPDFQKVLFLTSGRVFYQCKRTIWTTACPDTRRISTRQAG
jgi:hypothetical protein